LPTRRIFCGAFSLSTNFFLFSRNFVGDAFCRTRVLSGRAKFIAKNEGARVAPQAKTTPAKGREAMAATKARDRNSMLFYMKII
jgi:hypothetical protein